MRAAAGLARAPPRCPGARGPTPAFARRGPAPPRPRAARSAANRLSRPARPYPRLAAPPHHPRVPRARDRWHKRRATIWFDIHRHSPHTLISQRRHRDGSPRPEPPTTLSQLRTPPVRAPCASSARFSSTPSVGVNNSRRVRPKVPIVVEAQGGHGKRNRACRAGTVRGTVPAFLLVARQVRDRPFAPHAKLAPGACPHGHPAPEPSHLHLRPCPAGHGRSSAHCTVSVIVYAPDPPAEDTRQV